MSTNEKGMAAYNDFPESAAGDTPDAGYVRVYANTSGQMRQINDAGTDSALGGGGTIGGTLAPADNMVTRSDGTGGSTIQGSQVLIDDNGRFQQSVFILGSTYVNRFSIGDPATKTLSSDTCACGNDRNITVAAQTGTSDDFAMVTITGTAIHGEPIWFRADAGDVITVKHGTGNIYLYNNADVVLDEINPLKLMYNGTDWVQEFDGSGGGTVDLTTDVTGVLPIANGGTNGSTATAGFDNLAPTTTKGDLVVHNGTDNVRLPVGTNGYTLTPDSSDAEGMVWKLKNAFAILRDEKTSGTAGGTSTGSSWNARNLNTELYDPYSIVSIASDQFTPIAGDYVIEAHAPVGASSSNYTSRLRLYNVTGAASVEEGMSAAMPSAGVRTTCFLRCKFTANGTDAYRIDHYTSVGLATTGLGAAVSDGAAEAYLEILLIKVD